MHAKFIISHPFMQLFSNKKSSKKWGFTLVEMLIVIVIIGILAAALIPRLNTARGRANDTARKADLQQVSAVMVSYNIDHGVFPEVTASPDQAYNLEDIRDELVSAGISSIPLDPNRARTFEGVGDSNGCLTTNAGQYGYVAIKKNWISRWWFVLMAGTETLWGSNTIFESTTSQQNYINWCIPYDIPYNDVVICDYIDYDTNNTSLVVNSTAATPCTAKKDTDVLRYIYIY